MLTCKTGIMKRVLTYLFVVFSVGVNAQIEISFEEVARRLYDFYSATPVEKIYLHQDRTHYVAGETVWFKVYQSSTEQKVKSGIVYVELINGNNEQVVETKWPLFNGTAFGQIELPDTLVMGVYQIRAYTHWMQNFYPNGYFTREIMISSLYTSPGEIEGGFRVEKNILHAALCFTPVPKEKITYSLMLNGEKTKKYLLEPDEEGEVLLEINLPEEMVFEGPQHFVVETAKGSRMFPIPFTPEIQFYLFPEGGNLVAGIPSKVAFKVTDRMGKGIEASGVVTDETGKEINKFETTHHGNGFFYFQPEAGRKYTARLNHKNIQVEFPEAYAHGVVMNMKRWEENMRITIQSRIDAETFPLYLTIHQEGVSWFNAYIEQKEEANVIDIPINKLPSGIFTIMIYDKDNHAWCERLAFFNYPEELDLQLQTDKATYGKREKVTLTIDSPTSDLDNGSYSFAVVKAGLDPIATRNNLYTDYFLQSELRGKLDNPVAYLSNREMGGWQNLDLLLLTNGWRKYKWDRLMADNPEELNYLIEESLTFSGKVHLQNKKQKPEDITMNAVFRHPAIDDLQTFHPGEGGVFKFTGYDFRDTAEVILSAVDKKENILDISIFDHVGLPPDFYTYGKGISKTDNDSLYVEMSGVSIQHTAKDIDKTIFELPEVAVTARKRSKLATSRRLHSEDLIRPPLIVDKTRSYGGTLLNLLYLVPGLRVKESAGGGWSVRVLGAGETHEGPVFILNGSKVDPISIQSLPPSLIERIEVLPPAATMIYSRDGVGGGVAFYTNSYKEDCTPTKTLLHKFVGYNQEKTFFLPDYDHLNTQGYHDTDHRNTLHWQSEVVINDNGKAKVSFFTSDEKGEYLIHCEGRSAEGLIGVVQRMFQVE